MQRSGAALDEECVFTHDAMAIFATIASVACALVQIEAKKLHGILQLLQRGGRRCARSVAYAMTRTRARLRSGIKWACTSLEKMRNRVRLWAWDTCDVKSFKKGICIWLIASHGPCTLCVSGESYGHTAWFLLAATALRDSINSTYRICLTQM